MKEFGNWLSEDNQEFVEKVRKICEGLPLVEDSTPRTLKNGTVVMKVDSNSPAFDDTMNLIYREWNINKSMFLKKYTYRSKIGFTRNSSYFSREVKGEDFVKTFITTNEPIVYTIYSRGAVRVSDVSGDTFTFSPQGDLERLKDWLKNHIYKSLVEYTVMAIDDEKISDTKTDDLRPFLKNCYTKSSMQLLKNVSPEMSRILMYFGYLKAKGSLTNKDEAIEFNLESSTSQWYRYHTLKFHEHPDRGSTLLVSYWLYTAKKIKWKEKKILYTFDPAKFLRDHRESFDLDLVSNKKVWKLLKNPKNYRPVEEFVEETKNISRAESLGLI
jgi:hypothetical protein